jgi:hypothetical protein
MAEGDWTAAEHARERRRFIESRLRWRWVGLHTSILLLVTWLAGWAASWALLRAGMTQMALRYALSFALSYLVFLLAVRVWADFMRDERGGEAFDPGFVDVGVPDAEGCLFVVLLWLVALLLAGLFALAGGLPLLLEAAFEVVFAGVIVRRAARRQVLGDWLRVLVRNTWLPAVVALFALVTVAGLLQARAPQARTLAEAVRVLWPAGR